MITVSTKTLQAMVDKLRKCEPNKLLEMTKYWEINCSDKGLTMLASDGHNFVKVTDVATKGALHVIVHSGQFGKLVEKTSVDKIKMESKDGYLRVVGNGDYKVEIVEGEKYFTFEPLRGPGKDVPKTSLSCIPTVNKVAASTNASDAHLTGYYVDSAAAITTDGNRVCYNPTKVFDVPVLLTAEMVDLISILTADTVTVYVQDDKVMFTTPDTIVYGGQLNGIDEFPDLSGFIEGEFAYSVELSKAAVSQILERLSLFLQRFENGTISLQFHSDFLKVFTQTGSFEQLAYAKKTRFEEYACKLSITMLQEILNVLREEYFTLEFGNDAAVKLKSGNAVYILGKAESDSEGGEV